MTCMMKWALALSSINIMTELAKGKSPQAISLLESIGENTTMIQENMSDIVWAINLQNDHFESMLQRMQAFGNEIMEAKGSCLISGVIIRSIRFT